MIKEFWQEQKEKNKEAKRLKKINKKKPLSKEDKAIKIMGVIFTIFLIVIFFITNCSGEGDFTLQLGSITGLEKKYIDALNAEVDENLIFADGRMTDSDWDSAVVKMKASGLDIFTESGAVKNNLSENDYIISSDLTLKGRELGSACDDFTIENDSVMNIMDVAIYMQGGQYWLKIIAYIDLARVISVVDLPKVYLTSNSYIRVLDGDLKTISCNVKINSLEDEYNSVIVERFDTISKGVFSSYVSDNFVGRVSLLSEVFESKIVLNEDSITFAKRN